MPYARRGSEAQTRRISIGTADTGGVYYILGGGIAKVISANVPNTIATAEVTPGAVDNVKMLQNNSIDFAFTKSDVASEGIKGIGTFAATGKVPVRVIAVLYPDIAHVIVVPGINKLEDMKGKRISTSAPGSGHEMVAGKLLEAAGVDPREGFQTRADQPERIGQCLQGPQDRRVLLCHRAAGRLDARHQRHRRVGPIRSWMCNPTCRRS